MSEPVQPEASGAEPGHLTAVLGAKGGCGTTTVAVNLAAELARTRTVGLLDLDIGKGDVAGFLDLFPPHTVNDLVAALPQLDPNRAKGLSTHARAGFDAVIQPLALAEAQQLTGDETRALLVALRRTWDNLICDCGSRADPATLAAATEAQRVLVVLTPDIHALRDARRVLALLDAVKVPVERVELVVNRLGRHPGVALSVLEEELGRPARTVLPDDRAACAKADLEGRPLREVAPISPLTSGLRALSQGAEYHRGPLGWRLPWKA